MKSTLTTIESLSPSQHRQLLEIELLDDQKALFGDIHGALHGLTARPASDIQGYVLLVEDVPRGFFLVKSRSLLPVWAEGQTAVLQGLLIDHRYQGMGLGKACLSRLPDLIRALWPDIRQLMLAVDAANSAAHGLYLKQGWQACGNAGRSPTGLEQRMVLRLT